MIHIFGTSHVSQESLDLVEEKIEEIDPEVVALELDPLRLNSLLNGQQENRGGPLFVQVLQYFQKSIGEKTGVMPGEEMLLAYQTAEKNDIDVALIDQDIRITINKLKDVSFWEKLKAGAQLLVGLIFSGSFEIANEIPEEELIDQLLFEMEFKFPEMYDVLVEQRNKHMS
ncbi:MAG: pheromone shutdown protein TraB, partial [Candidatus Nanohaloarchaea archaeon]